MCCSRGFSWAGKKIAADLVIYTSTPERSDASKFCLRAHQPPRLRHQAIKIQTHLSEIPRCRWVRYVEDPQGLSRLLLAKPTKSAVLIITSQKQLTRLLKCYGFTLTTRNVRWRWILLVLGKPRETGGPVKSLCGQVTFVRPSRLKDAHSICQHVNRKGQIFSKDPFKH